jgi:hypothetical protein
VLYADGLGELSYEGAAAVDKTASCDGSHRVAAGARVCEDDAFEYGLMWDVCHAWCGGGTEAIGVIGHVYGMLSI